MREGCKSGQKRYRFTASELVIDESLNKWGMPSNPEKAQFDYIVSMEDTPRRPERGGVPPA